MELIYRVEIKGLSLYFVDAKVYKNDKYIGDSSISVNDTHSLKGQDTYEYSSRTDVDSVTFGLQMELKKFLIDIGVEVRSNIKRKKSQTFGWTH